MATKPNVHVKSHTSLRFCGACGERIYLRDTHCRKCGEEIDWKSIYPVYKCFNARERREYEQEAIQHQDS